MTASYLLANKQQVNNPQINKSYRVIGFYNEASIYTLEKIEDNTAYFKGYVMGKDLNKLKFFEVEGKIVH